MRTLNLYLFLVSFVAHSGVAPAGASGQLPKELAPVLLQQSGSDSVTLTITVTNKQGTYVRGLSREDFTVFDGKTPLEITSFSFGEEPMSIGIVYDKSQVEGKYSRRGVAASRTLRQALERFVKLSNSSNDYFLIQVAKQPQVLADWTRDHERLLRPLDDVKPETETALYDACIMAVEKLRNGENRKRVLLLISDGSDNSSRQSYRELRHLLMNTDTLVYAIATHDEYEIKEADALGIGLSLTLDDLSSVTGGGRVYPKNSSELIAAAELLARELRQQYKITFKVAPSKGDDKWRELKVKVTPSSSAPREFRNLIVRSGKGYYSL
jgi:Ca-activated chloride channel homolog